MKLCYQVATPDVMIAPSVTAFQGDLSGSLETLSELGYDGVEFMTLNPNKLDWRQIEKLLSKHNLDLVLVCTGEIFGQEKLTFMDPDQAIREQAIKRIKEIMDFAACFGANINIGRVRGGYTDILPRELSYEYAVEGFSRLAEYGQLKHVKVAIEPVTYMQTNFINTSEEAIRICKDVGSDMLQIMLDIFHVNIEEKDIIKSIIDSKDYTMHVHLADNNRRYPGACGLDFTKILQTLKQTGYNGAICTEIYQLPHQLAAAQGAIEHLRPILNAL